MIGRQAAFSVLGFCGVGKRHGSARTQQGKLGIHSQGAGGGSVDGTLVRGSLRVKGASGCTDQIGFLRRPR